MNDQLTAVKSVDLWRKRTKSCKSETRTILSLCNNYCLSLEISLAGQRHPFVRNKNISSKSVDRKCHESDWGPTSQLEDFPQDSVHQSFPLAAASKPTCYDTLRALTFALEIPPSGSGKPGHNLRIIRGI